jgi:hypothetical protein
MREQHHEFSRLLILVQHSQPLRLDSVDGSAAATTGQDIVYREASACKTMVLGLSKEAVEDQT